MAELLSSASGLEARYIVRTVLDLLRVGTGEGVLRDALVWAYAAEVHYNPEEKSIEPESREEYNKVVEKVQEAYDLLNDFSELALVLKTAGLAGLSTIKLKPYVNIKLYLKISLINMLCLREQIDYLSNYLKRTSQMRFA